MSAKDTKKIIKYTIYPCKGGWLLNTYWDNKNSNSEVFSDKDGMRLLTRIADNEGIIDEHGNELPAPPLD